MGLNPDIVFATIVISIWSAICLLSTCAMGSYFIILQFVLFVCQFLVNYLLTDNRRDFMKLNCISIAPIMLVVIFVLYVL